MHLLPVISLPDVIFESFHTVSCFEIVRWEVEAIVLQETSVLRRSLPMTVSEEEDDRAPVVILERLGSILGLRRRLGLRQRLGLWRGLRPRLGGLCSGLPSLGRRFPAKAPDVPTPAGQLDALPRGVRPITLVFDR